MRSRQQEYEQLVAQAMRLGEYLSSPQGKLLSPAGWNEVINRYQVMLDRVRRLGDELRSTPLA